MFEIYFMLGNFGLCGAKRLLILHLKNIQNCQRDYVGLSQMKTSPGLAIYTLNFFYYKIVGNDYQELFLSNFRYQI